jgi:predicted esterase
MIIAVGILPGHAQQIEKGIRVSTGEYLGFLEYKPEDYSSKTSTKYPLIIFLHGIGERGNGTTDLHNVQCCGIPRIIKKGNKMKFTWNGKTETFIVLSPQCPKSYGMWPSLFIDELIKYAKNNLRVDANRIFLTGLSMGGGGTMKYISTAADQPKNLAAVATICAPCTFKNADYVSDAKLPVWSFHALDDKIAPASCSQSAIRKINGTNPAVKALLNTWPTGGHLVWDRVYTDTNYKYQGVVNIYEWFLGQNKSLSVNKLPVANAGGTINITTGTAVASLNASASSDADGKIVRYVWKKIEGPAVGAITNAFGPNSSTTVTGLAVPGTYKYELSVVDDRASFTRDTVTVNVSNGVSVTNKAPLAKAGNNVTITLPVNTVTLDGSGSSDEDGTVDNYAWSKVSGPSASIITPSGKTTKINNLVEGTYIFKLNVTDNKGATAEDQVTVTVKPEVVVVPNIAPVADAGNDKAITLPVNKTTVDGSASADEDGTIASYEWTMISGPTQFQIVDANKATTEFKNLVAGTYQLKLKVTDNKGEISEDVVTVKVNTPSNAKPVANAGTDVTITLPVNKTDLIGTASSDADGTITTFTWEKISGPSQYIIADDSAATTHLTNLSQGTYKFLLTVTDNKGATDADTVIVKVNAAVPDPNMAPDAQAGSNKTITLPLDHVTLDGTSSSDADGTIASYKWSFISGPETYVLADANTVSTEVTGMVAGTYSFRLEVKDNDGDINADTVNITVKEADAPPPPPNVIPDAKAGEDITITLPINEVTLNGSTSNDVDGTLTNYSWLKIEGPAEFQIISPSYHITKVENLVEGTYTFRLHVKDNDGALGFDTIKVTVLHAANVAPVSKSGADIEVQLPVSNVTLSGLDSYDTDGTIAIYKWEMISGPGSVTIADRNAATTDVSGLHEGQYKFRLSVTDNDGTVASDVISVNVLPETNIAPVANAGSNDEVSLPNASIKLNGRDSYDQDGIIASYSWVKISGPGGVTITNSGTATPSIVGVTAGVYEFRLTVKDDKGATASDVVMITVIAAPVVPVENAAPVADAGVDQSIAFPESTVIIDAGKSSDNDGTIASYSWKQLSGPSTATVASPGTKTTDISHLETGDYTFELTVTDDKGLVSTDVIEVSVVNNMRYTEEMTVYPNPARSNINLQLTTDTLGATRVTIYSANGLVVHSFNTQKTQPQLSENINISTLQTGVYYMEVIIGGKVRKITKFVKQP